MVFGNVFELIHNPIYGGCIMFLESVVLVAVQMHVASIALEVRAPPQNILTNHAARYTTAVTLQAKCFDVLLPVCNDQLARCTNVNGVAVGTPQREPFRKRGLRHCRIKSMHQKPNQHYIC